LVCGRLLVGLHLLVVHELLAGDVIPQHEVHVLRVREVEVRVEYLGQAAVVLVSTVELHVPQMVQHFTVVKRGQQLTVAGHAQVLEVQEFGG